METRQPCKNIVKSRAEGSENVQLAPDYPEVTPDVKSSACFLLIISLFFHTSLTVYYCHLGTFAYIYSY